MELLQQKDKVIEEQQQMLLESKQTEQFLGERLKDAESAFETQDQEMQAIEQEHQKHITTLELNRSIIQQLKE